MKRKVKKQHINRRMRQELTRLARSFEVAYYQEVGLEKISGAEYKALMKQHKMVGGQQLDDNKEYMNYAIAPKKIGAMQYRKDIIKAYTENGLNGVRYAVEVIKNRLIKCKLTFPQYYHLLKEAQWKERTQEDETKLALQADYLNSLIEYKLLSIA